MVYFGNFKKYLIGVCIFLGICTTSWAQNNSSKWSLALQTKIGHDMQTQSNDYINNFGPIILPSAKESPILGMEKPYQINLDIGCASNTHFSWKLSISRTSRAFRYWSMDTGNTQDYHFRNDKIQTKLVTWNINPGIQFQTNLGQKLNIYCSQYFGIGFGRSNFPFGPHVTNSNKNIELLYLHTKTEAVGVMTSQDIIFSLNSRFGMVYKLNENVSLDFGFEYVNEFSNGSSIYILQYNLQEERFTGGYNPTDLEFKTLYQSIGLSYSF